MVNLFPFMIKQQAMEAYGGEDVLYHILDLCTRQTERNGQLHTPTALPMGKKPFGPTEQNAQMAPALAMMLWRTEISIDPHFSVVQPIA
jgi:hypothetical protein